jgi:hypothetical protein
MQQIILNRWAITFVVISQESHKEVIKYLEDLFKLLDIEQYIVLPIFAHTSTSIWETTYTYKFKKEFKGLFDEKGEQINESVMRFERGLNPKAAMGVGGVTLQDVFDQILKDPIDKWEQYIVKTLVGKNVSGKMMKYSGDKRNWEGPVNRTVRVDVVVNWEIEGDINVKDINGDLYCILINEKIHIG